MSKYIYYTLYEFLIFTHIYIINYSLVVDAKVLLQREQRVRQQCLDEIDNFTKIATMCSEIKLKSVDYNNFSCIFEFRCIGYYTRVINVKERDLNVIHGNIVQLLTSSKMLFNNTIVTSLGATNFTSINSSLENTTSINTKLLESQSTILKKIGSTNISISVPPKPTKLPESTIHIKTSITNKNPDEIIVKLPKPKIVTLSPLSAKEKLESPISIHTEKA